MDEFRPSDEDESMRPLEREVWLDRARFDAEQLAEENLADEDDAW